MILDAKSILIVTHVFMDYLICPHLPSGAEYPQASCVHSYQVIYTFKIPGITNTITIQSARCYAVQSKIMCNFGIHAFRENILMN